MSRNRFLIDLPPADADAVRADAAKEHLSVAAHLKRVILLDVDRRRARKGREQDTAEKEPTP